MRPQDGKARRIAAIATGQKGLATREQLLAAGIGDGAIKRRVRSGTLFVEFRGVYRVGHKAPNLETRYLAAVLACGPGGPGGRPSPRPPEAPSLDARRSHAHGAPHTRSQDAKS